MPETLVEATGLAAVNGRAFNTLVPSWLLNSAIDLGFSGAAVVGTKTAAFEQRG